MIIIGNVKHQWMKSGVITFAIILCTRFFARSFLRASSSESVQSNSFTSNTSLSPIRGTDVVVVMGSNGNHPLSRHEALIRANRMEYARFHGKHCHIHMLTLGYDFLEVNFSEHPVPNVGPHWSKIPVFVETFKTYPQAKWLWWLDFDAIIMTPTIDLGSHLLNPDIMYSRLRKGEIFPLSLKPGQEDEYMNLPEDPDVSKIDLILTGDYWGPVNSGSLFLRRSAWTDILLDFWIDPFYVDYFKHSTDTHEQEALVGLMRFHQSIREHVGFVPPRLINAHWVDEVDLRWEPNDFVIHFAGCV